MTESNKPIAIKRQMVGEVISDKMTKTIVVRVSRRVRHPRYNKVVTRLKKYYAHDEQQQARAGDLVRIEESRPLSRLKRWRLVEVMKQAMTEEAGAGT